MTDKLMAHFVQCGTAKEIWDAVKRSYLDVSDSSQAYELMKKSFQSRHGGRPLSEYYNELNSIFLELDYRRPNDMECTNDIEKLRIEFRYSLPTLISIWIKLVVGSWLPLLYQVWRKQIHKFVVKSRDNSPWELKIDRKRRPLLSKRTTHNQHLLFVLPTIFLVSALTITAQDIPKMFIGRSMAIRSGSNSSKLKRRIKNLHKLLSHILLHLLLLM